MADDSGTVCPSIEAVISSSGLLLPPALACPLPSVERVGSIVRVRKGVVIIRHWASKWVDW